MVRFAIGYQTELEPQSAVWVENEKGDFIRTLYVSGFSGNVKEVQVVLTEWAAASKFETDANTGASIAAGWHTYVWDLKDSHGDRVPEGKYVVHVEVRHWPSMVYETLSLPVDVGVKKYTAQKDGGDLIPVLEVKYISE